MNERIQELAKSVFWNGDLELYSERLETFAQLIVRECIKEIEFQYGGGSDQPMDSEWDRAIECVSSMVKYRFGAK